MARVVAGLLLGSELEREREKDFVSGCCVCGKLRRGHLVCTCGRRWWVVTLFEREDSKIFVSKSIISFTVCVYGRRPLLCFFLSLLVIFRLYFFEGRKNGGQMASVCLTYFKL
jgi:hypothetical protein